MGSGLKELSESLSLPLERLTFASSAWTPNMFLRVLQQLQVLVHGNITDQGLMIKFDFFFLTEFCETFKANVNICVSGMLHCRKAPC